MAGKPFVAYILSCSGKCMVNCFALARFIVAGVAGTAPLWPPVMPAQHLSFTSRAPTLQKLTFKCFFHGHNKVFTLTFENATNRLCNYYQCKIAVQSTRSRCRFFHSHDLPSRYPVAIKMDLKTNISMSFNFSVLFVNGFSIFVQLMVMCFHAPRFLFS